MYYNRNPRTAHDDAAQVYSATAVRPMDCDYVERHSIQITDDEEGSVFRTMVDFVYRRVDLDMAVIKDFERVIGDMIPGNVTQEVSYGVYLTGWLVWQ